MARKTLAILVLLALALGGAQAETVVLHRENTFIRALWVRDGALYLISWGEYFVWADSTLETHSFQPLLADGESILTVAPGDDGLWALIGGVDGVRAARVTLEGDEASVESGVAVDWDADDVSDFPAFVNAGRLVFLSRSEGAVAACTLATGDVDVYDSDADGYLIDARAVCPYKDGKALVASRMDGAQPRIDVLMIDFSSGDVAPAFSLAAQDIDSFGALFYDEVSDAVTYVLDGTLSRVTGFDADTAEALGDASSIDATWGASAARMDDGTIVLAGWNTALAYGQDQATPVSLSISADNDELVNDAYYAYLEEYPDAQINISNEYVSPGDVSQAILTQSTAYDIYVTSLNWADYGALYEKGYLAPLAGSEKLTAFSAELYPAIREAVEKDGALVALPVRLDVSAIQYNPAAFQALGLTEADVPKSWPAFFSLMQQLPARIEGTSYTVFDPSLPAEGLPEDICMSFLYDYMLYLENEPSLGMKFDTEILRALFAEYEKVDFDALGAGASWDEETDTQIADQYTLFPVSTSAGCDARALSQWTSQVDGADAPVYTRPMPLSLGDETEPMVKGEIYVAIVNPYSENQAAALGFLEAALDQMPEITRANMTPGWTQPIQSDGIDDVLASYEQRIAEFEEEVANAKGEEKAQYQEMLDAQMADYAGWQEKYWSVTEEDLAAYRAYADHMRIWHNFGLGMEGEDALYQELNRYMDGAIDCDTMLQNIDKKINMMLLEDD